MIGIITQNNTVLSGLIALLSDFQATEWTPDTVFQAVLLADPLPDTLPVITAPIISLGTPLTEGRHHIKAPVSPDTLRRRIQIFLEQNKQMPVFENAAFLFEGSRRSLTDKNTHSVIQLTEKENALLCRLVTALPQPIDKETLLSDVWNYRPDTETHTVESHIYALRQKIGTTADSLIQNTPAGYTLVTD